MDTPQSNAPQNETSQSNAPQNDAPQNETSQNNKPQNDDKKQTKKQTIAGIIGGLIVIIFFVNLCSGGYDPQNAPFGDEENLAYHKKYCNSHDINNGYACNQVGIKYITMHDEENGILYYEKGCNLKFGVACLNLGNTYLNNNDNIKAAKYFKKACDYSRYDDGKGCYMFGSLHLKLYKNESTTFEYYKKACDKHYGEGCYAVGLNYAVGDGVVKNMDIAKDYFKKGCKYGHKSSCDELR